MKQTRAFTGIAAGLLLRASLACCALLCFVWPAMAQQPSAGQKADECRELPRLKEQLHGAQERLRDYPQLNRYRQQNTQLAPPKAGERRVIFLGDSITDWWDDEGFGGFFPGKPYVNRGIGGQVTGQMLLRLFPDVIALGPQAVVILAGTNDLARSPEPATLKTIEDNLAAMSGLLDAHGVRVVLASLLPVSDAGRDRRSGQPIKRTERRPPEMIRRLNAWIKDYAARNGHTYLDYHSALADGQGFLKEGLHQDGLHANAKGYGVMAPLAEAAIEDALKHQPKRR